MAYLQRYLMAGFFALASGLMLPARPPASPERQLSFTVFSAGRTGPVSYRPREDATPLPITFYPTARSPLYRYAGPAALQFLDATTGLVVSEVTIPPQLRQALLIFSSSVVGNASSPRYRVQLVDDGTRHHPLGTLLILNLSGLELTGTVNSRPIRLRSGFNAPLPVRDSARLTLRTPWRERTYQAYAETITLGSSDRALLLLLPPYRPGSLEVQSRVLLDAPRGESTPAR